MAIKQKYGLVMRAVYREAEVVFHYEKRGKERRSLKAIKWPNNLTQNSSNAAALQLKINVLINS